jgi:NAD(P)-dependent dehydrogenase (short-subunit alcohol dehydrogenase family)
MAEAITSVPAKSSFKSVWYATNNPPMVPTTSYAGQVILITGGNAGLGFEAAKKFAALAAKKVILAVRSLDRGKVAQAKIEKETRCGPGVIELVELDMDQFASMDRFLDSLDQKFPVIHVAILNAGVNGPYYSQSSEGWETFLQVNAISTAYLAICLLPKLRSTSNATGKPTLLEIVTSMAHGDVDIATVTDSESILSKLNKRENFNFTKQYSITKLLAMWSMKRIADKVDPSEVIVLSACPNLCKSDMARGYNTGLGLILRLADGAVKSVIGRTAEQGGRALVNATNVSSKAHGGFYSLDRIAV